MELLPAQLEPLINYNQFMMFRLDPDPKRPGKFIKKPFDYVAGHVVSAQDQQYWRPFLEVAPIAQAFGDRYGVSFILSRVDPFWCLDIDNCINPDGTYSAFAADMVKFFPHCAIEISQSGKGLHIIGAGEVPEHGKVCKTEPAELYTELRMISLTGNMVNKGFADADASDRMPTLVNKWFPVINGEFDSEWRTEPVDEWFGTTNNEILITKACNAKLSNKVLFGSAASFSDLFNRNVAALARAFPSQNGVDAYDQSRADAALANRLAFWTGKNHERIKEIMLMSALVRDKWQREDYMRDTIKTAVSLCEDVHNNKGELKTDNTEPPAEPAPPGDDGSTIAAATAYNGSSRFLTGAMVAEHFKQCVYITSHHAVLIPTGEILNRDQFNVRYGGYTYQISPEKTTEKAFDAFALSQYVNFPKATRPTFEPKKPFQTLINSEGLTEVNTYKPVKIKRKSGDPSPLLNHYKALYPDGDDYQILISYAASVVQNQGTKFQWAPVMQGPEGTGKTVLCKAILHAIGRRYSHTPRASDLGNKFNAWVEGKTFFYVDEIYMPERRAILEDIKTLISDDWIEIQGKRKDQEAMRNYANGILNTNHEDGVLINPNSRRYSPLFTTQRNASDISRDFTPGYWKNLHEWLRTGGYEIMAEFLHTTEIDARFDPAGELARARAPMTTSLHKAVYASLGGVEQQILESVESLTPGFRGGWVSSIKLDALLVKMNLHAKVTPHRRAKMLEELGYIKCPALERGRCTRTLMHEGGGRPILYVKKDHPSAAISDSSDAVTAYETAQGYSTGATIHKFA